MVVTTAGAQAMTSQGQPWRASTGVAKSTWLVPQPFANSRNASTGSARSGDATTWTDSCTTLCSRVAATAKRKT